MVNGMVWSRTLTPPPGSAVSNKMAKDMAQTEMSTVPTRLGVLEHGYQALSQGFEAHRSEVRSSFLGVQQALERMSGEIARRAQPTNWTGIIASIACTVAVFSAIFGLAEWRVANATNPLKEINISQQEQIKSLYQLTSDMRIRIAVIESENNRVKIEQDARIRARVDIDTRARESAK